MEQEEKNIAIGYLHAPGDEKYKCELTTKRLIIYYSSKRHEYIIEMIRRLTFEHRKLLMPILFAGIFTPLVILAYFRDYMHPMLAIVLIVTGIFGFYYGWMGQKTLTVRFQSGFHDFPLEQIPDELNKFVEFINNYISGKSENYRLIYSIIDTNEGMDPATKPRFYTYDQLKTIKNRITDTSIKELLIIDPSRLDRKNQLALDRTGNFLEMNRADSINEFAIVKRLGGIEIAEFLSRLE